MGGSSLASLGISNSIEAMSQYNQAQQSDYQAMFGAYGGFQGQQQQMLHHTPYMPIAGLGSIVKPETKKESVHMISEVANDLKQFIRGHKSTIYWIAILLIIDHFFFQDAFREKLKSMMGNFVGKIESKINETKV